jgi:hypothetical protein
MDFGGTSNLPTGIPAELSDVFGVISRHLEELIEIFDERQPPKLHVEVVI